MDKRKRLVTIAINMQLMIYTFTFASATILSKFEIK